MHKNNKCANSPGTGRAGINYKSVPVAPHWAEMFQDKFYGKYTREERGKKDKMQSSFTKYYEDN